MVNESESVNSEREYAIRAHDRANADLNFANQGALNLSASTLKSLLIINGGAAIAMLGFVSSLAGGTGIESQMLALAANPITYFAFGVAAASLASGLAYIVMYLQAAYHATFKHQWEHPYVVAGKRTKLTFWITSISHVLAVVTSISSLVFFICGIVEVNELISVSWQYKVEK